MNALLLFPKSLGCRIWRIMAAYARVAHLASCCNMLGSSDRVPFVAEGSQRRVNITTRSAAMSAVFVQPIQR